MNQTLAITVLLVLGVVLANWPFFTSRLLVVGPLRPDRGFGWRLLELLLLGSLLIAAGFAWEDRLGQRHPQGWAFYVTMLALMVTFAFPGFAWRFLRRQRGD